jgi:hypothetical protein
MTPDNSPSRAARAARTPAAARSTQHDRARPPTGGGRRAARPYSTPFPLLSAAPLAPLQTGPALAVSRSRRSPVLPGFLLFGVWATWVDMDGRVGGCNPSRGPDAGPWPVRGWHWTGQVDRSTEDLSSRRPPAPLPAAANIIRPPHRSPPTTSPPPIPNPQTRRRTVGQK